ncbi:hypothetical protein Peur_050248 [Populus x canadensis]
MTVLERQQARFKWLLLQQQNNYVNQYNSLESCSMPTDQFHGFVDHESMNGDIIDWKKKPEMYLGNNDLPKYGGFSLNGTGLVANNRMDFGQSEVAGSVEIDRCLSRTSSCQIGVVEAAKIEEKVVAIKVAGEDLTLMENKQFNNGSGDNSNKRKAEFVAAEECDNKIKEVEVDSKARREKISKKMKSLQDLVPGCNKITGRAGMLDEIINYVQSLQRQVEFLSMKLAVLNPRPEFNIDNFSGKEFSAYVEGFPAATMPSTISNLTDIQLNLMQRQATSSEPKALTNPPQLVPVKTTSSSAFINDLCLDPLAVIASTLGVFRGIYQSQTSDVILETNQHLKNSDSIIQKF